MGKINVINPSGGSGGGNVTTSGMTAGKVPLATTPTNIEDSEFYQITPSSGGFTGTFVVGERVAAKKISSFGTAPTIAVGAGAGAGATVVLAAGSTDMKGTFTITFGPVPVINSLAVQLTFNVPYASLPVTLISFAGQTGGVPAARPTLYINQLTATLATFDLYTDAAAGTLANKVQTYNYFVVQ